MAVSDAKRRANDKWDSVHSFRFSVKMGRDEADKLKAACQVDGVTPHAFFLRAARDMIAAHADGDGDGVSSVKPSDREARAAASHSDKITFDRKKFAPLLDKLGKDANLEDLFLEFLRQAVSG